MYASHNGWNPNYSNLCVVLYDTIYLKKLESKSTTALRTAVPLLLLVLAILGTLQLRRVRAKGSLKPKFVSFPAFPWNCLMVVA